MSASDTASVRRVVLERSAAPDSRPLVIGFGNTLLGDDGAGIRLVERLRRDCDPAAADFVDGGTMSFSLLGYVEAAPCMLMIDAANLGESAGAAKLFEGAAMDDYLSGYRRRTVHEVGLIDLLDTARLLGCMPPRRALLCIQPERIDWCDQLSIPVAAALPHAARLATAMLERWRNA
jgi:hydrogenase maturation protease